MRNRHVLFALVVASLAVACSKKETPATTTGSSSAALTPSAAAPVAATASASPAEAAPAAAANLVAKCGDAAAWEPLALKVVQTGTLHLPKPGAALPTFNWKGCDDGPGCTQLDLTGTQRVLATGQLGNDLKLLITEECDTGTAAYVVDTTGKTLAGVFGTDFVFDSAALGGDRFLLGGYAKFRTAEAPEGYVPREYLVTGRVGAAVKVEAIRNQQKWEPHTVSSQLVTVQSEVGKLCTSAFWKLGVNECEFDGPPNSDFILFGQHLLYNKAGSESVWNSKGERSGLITGLDWLASDGVNFAWSAQGSLYYMQPKWDLPNLDGKIAPGAPGPAPDAFGCGRLLTKEDGWLLRNLAEGTVQRLPADVFGANPSGVPAAMNCSSVLFEGGMLFALKNLPKPEPVTPNPAAAASGAASAAPAEPAASAPTP